jgi:hypothetical protein
MYGTNPSLLSFFLGWLGSLGLGSLGLGSRLLLFGVLAFLGIFALISTLGWRGSLLAGGLLGVFGGSRLVFGFLDF